MGRYEFNKDTRRVLEAMPGAFAIYQEVDHKDVLLLVSDGYCQLMNMTREEVEKYQSSYLYEYVHPDDVEELANKAKHLIRHESGYEVVFRTRFKGDDRYHLIHGEGHIIETRDGSKLSVVCYMKESGLLDILGDLKVRIEESFDTKKMDSKAPVMINYYDALTGLPNMSLFYELAGKGIQRALRLNHNISIISCNFTGLKRFNSRYGMEEGNALLVAFSNILRKHFTNDCCSRFGEDQFYAYVSTEMVDLTTQAIIQEASEMNNGRSLPVRIGVYHYIDSGVAISTACDKARVACNLDRSSYTSLVTYYDEQLEHREKTRDYILQNIREAIKRGFIKVYYQPIVRTLNQKVCGAEALVRWQTPEGEFISPGEFIPVLEESNLTYLVDRYVIKQVAMDLRELINRGIDVVPISFNLSRTDFLKGSPYVYISEVVRDNGLPRELFRIEITETTVMAEPKKIQEEIAKFHKDGFDVLMDDFGSAYSSLNTLKKFDFDEIKIDMGFMREFDDRSCEILKSIIGMGKNLGIHTLTEGVETEEQVEFLKRIGCEKIQGYYYFKPEPWEKLVEDLDKSALYFETREEQFIYKKIGMVNLMSDQAMALLSYNGNVFCPIFENEAYRRVLDRGDDAFNKDIDEILNNKHSDLLKRFRELANLTIQTGQEETMTFVVKDRYCRAYYQNLISSTETHIIKAVLVDITSEKDGETEKRLDSILRNLMSTYEDIYQIDLEADEVTVVATSVKDEIKGHCYKGFQEFVEARAQGEKLWAKDRQRFVRFLDGPEFVAYFKKCGKGSTTDIFRICRSDGNYHWMEITLVVLPDYHMKRYLLCIKDIEDELYRQFETVAYEVMEPSKVDFYGENLRQMLDRMYLKELKWDTLIERANIKIFWKDLERRFIGASQSFLDYYGLKSQEEIIGRTDEDMEWNVDVEDFKQNEYQVVENGEEMVSVSGQTIAGGMIHNILYSKFPLYNNGKLIGMVGYFYDTDQIMDLQDKVTFDAFIDKNTGFLNAHGMILTSMRYDDEQKLKNRDYTTVALEFPIYKSLFTAYGREYAEAFIKYMAEIVEEIFPGGAIVARIKSGTFYLYLRNTSREEASRFVEKFKREIEGITSFQDHSLTIYINSGIVVGSERNEYNERVHLMSDRLMSDRRQKIVGQYMSAAEIAEQLDFRTDMPIPYCVLKVITDETRKSAIDIEYVYANQKYCQWVEMNREDIVGERFYNIFKSDNHELLQYCYRAGIQKEEVHDRMYSPEMNHWITFVMTPSSIPDTLVCVFLNIDKEMEQKGQMDKNYTTNDMIIHFAELFSEEKDYATLMKQILKELSLVIDADRIYILEKVRDSVSYIDEWCAPEVYSNRGMEPGEEFQKFIGSWGVKLREESRINIEDIAGIKDVYPKLYEFFSRQRTYCIMAAPIYIDKELYGYLGVDNYRSGEILDMEKLLETVASLLSYRIANHAMVKELQQRAQYDDLTGLLNRAGFNREVDAFLEAGGGTKAVLMIIDLDNFKFVNDMYGHDIGDHVLVSLARLMESCFDRDTIIGRNGGDEFIILLKRHTVKYAQRFIDAFLSREKIFTVKGEQHSYTVSIGYAEYPRQAKDFHKLYRAADEALYAAKLQGKNLAKEYALDMDVMRREKLGFTIDELVANVPGGLLVYQEETKKVLYVSDVLLQLLDCSSEEGFYDYIQGDILRFIAADDRNRVHTDIERHMREKTYQKGIFANVITAHGVEKQVMIRGNIFDNEHYGRVCYTLITTV